MIVRRSLAGIREMQQQQLYDVAEERKKEHMLILFHERFRLMQQTTLSHDSDSAELLSDMVQNMCFHPPMDEPTKDRVSHAVEMYAWHIASEGERVSKKILHKTLQSMLHWSSAVLVGSGLLHGFLQVASLVLERLIDVAEDPRWTFEYLHDRVFYRFSELNRLQTSAGATWGSMLNVAVMKLFEKVLEWAMLWAAAALTSGFADECERFVVEQTRSVLMRAEFDAEQERKLGRIVLCASCTVSRMQRGRMVSIQSCQR